MTFHYFKSFTKSIENYTFENKNNTPRLLNPTITSQRTTRAFSCRSGIPLRTPQKLKIVSAKNGHHQLKTHDKRKIASSNDGKLVCVG